MGQLTEQLKKDFIKNGFEKKEATKKEHELCDMLAWLSCHADEDCPSEYRSKHFRIALKKAVDYLEDSGWYDFNSGGYPESKSHNQR